MRNRPGALLSRGGCVLFAAVLMVLALAAPARAQQAPPRLTAPVNVFANVIDPGSERALDTLIRSLEQASGDVVVVATVDTFKPYGDIREYAVKMFENGGQGIGQKNTDNGLLVLVAVTDRQVWIEVGYDLEGFITDGFAGETSRDVMTPEFRQGNYGAGIMAGVTLLVMRIADGRNVTLRGIPQAGPAPSGGPGGIFMLAIFVLFIVVNALSSRLRGGRRGFGSGWNSGVGPFGGGFGGGIGGGGFGGGGFGGGFGGFGGGRSGGGGGGAGW